ncbi:uncharacterized protein METZ01_LOCUS246341, partial [marine metagenome]
VANHQFSCPPNEANIESTTVASVAQLVEQLFRKQQVAGSSPAT